MTYKVKSGGVRGFFRRNSNTISFSVILLCITAIFLMQAITISQLQRDVEKQTEIIESVADLAEQIDLNARDSSRQIDGIDRHLDCIVYFFSQDDRSQKAIDNIESCRITAKSPQPAQTPPQALPEPVEPKKETPKKPARPTKPGTPLIDTPPMPLEENPGLIDRITNPIRELLNL